MTAHVKQRGLFKPDDCPDHHPARGPLTRGSKFIKGSDATASVQLTGWERLRATSVLSEFVEENLKCTQIGGGE